MSARQGEVWHETRRVGTLSEDARGNLYFSYDTYWLESGFPVSISLPLSNADRAVEALPFFEGLLPEGRVRKRISREHGVDENDVLGMLLRIGADCAGALSILPAGEGPEFRGAPPSHIDDDRIAEVVRSRGETMPVMAGAPRRFSLAGAQEKLTVVLDDEGYACPDRENPSSHILKFETVLHVCVAEALANTIYRIANLPVVETEFLRLPAIESPFLRIHRYDREIDSTGRRHRLHQEDMTQAAGKISLHKYQTEGGPSLAILAEILRAHVTRPAEAIGRIRDWQILNFLIGNWDGHGKNLALLYRQGSAVPELAPFYDVVAIEFLNLLRPGTWSREMAFAVGGEHTPERIGRTEWTRFAQELGVPPRQFLMRLDELATGLPGMAEAACVEFVAAHGEHYEDLLVRLVESVRRRCNWALRPTH